MEVVDEARKTANENWRAIDVAILALGGQQPRIKQYISISALFHIKAQPFTGADPRRPPSGDPARFELSSADE
jgi:hypothetical protein